jgi:hypothetical protein
MGLPSLFLTVPEWYFALNAKGAFNRVLPNMIFCIHERIQGVNKYPGKMHLTITHSKIVHILVFSLSFFFPLFSKKKKSSSGLPWNR